jgi:hypothetical protein
MIDFFDILFILFVGFLPVVLVGSMPFFISRKGEKIKFSTYKKPYFLCLIGVSLCFWGMIVNRFGYHEKLSPYLFTIINEPLYFLIAKIMMFSGIVLSFFSVRLFRRKQKEFEKKV